jgi:hypothetical protein
MVSTSCGNYSQETIKAGSLYLPITSLAMVANCMLEVPS